MKSKKIITPDQALERLEALCAKSERCTDELRRKLYTWGIAAEERERIIEQLERTRFVDDERFARAYVGDKWRFSRWGKRKIMAGLATKRITGAVAREAIEEEINAEEYYEGLLEVTRERLRRTDAPDDYERGMKVMRSLIAAGFETPLAARAVREVAQSMAEEGDEAQ